LRLRCPHSACAPQDEQPVAALVALTQHLESARFRDFWLAQDACQDVVAGVSGFYEAVSAHCCSHRDTP
jgi:hypothetical protein